MQKIHNTERSQRTLRQKLETGVVASVFVVFVAFPYCDVLKVAHR
jgi:hypothetical protein